MPESHALEESGKKLENSSSSNSHFTHKMETTVSSDDVHQS